MARLFSRLSRLSLLLLALPYPTAAQTSGKGYAERYWDCCKPDCAWEAKADFDQPVQTCDNRNNPLTDFSVGSSCGGGNGYACADQSPWAVNDTFSYGFAGVFIQEHASDYWCCACYELRFTSGAAEGKKMVVQAHNAAFDVTSYNRFTLAVPGGYPGDAQACATQYDVSSSVFGVEDGGVSSKNECDDLPEPLRDGCRWRFDWLEDASSPGVNYTRVTCPTALTNITGCIRNDDTTFTSAAASAIFSGSVLTVGFVVAATFSYL